MLLIWGWRSRVKLLREGEFFCPHCGSDRHYHWQQVRRWFTLFFIPLIPLKILGEQVACTTCKRTFRPEVLDTPTSAELEVASQHALRVGAIAVLRAGDAPDPESVAAVADVVRSTGLVGYDVEAVQVDLNQIDSSQLDAYLAPLAGGLAVQGKELFMGHLVGVAVGGGGMTAAQRELLAHVAGTLGLTATHFAGIVAQVTQASA